MPDSRMGRPPQARQAGSSKPHTPAMRALGSDAAAMASSQGVAATSWGKGSEPAAASSRMSVVAKASSSGSEFAASPSSVQTQSPAAAAVVTSAAPAPAAAATAPALAANLSGLWVRDDSRSDAAGYEKALVSSGVPCRQLQGSCKGSQKGPPSHHALSGAC